MSIIDYFINDNEALKRIKKPIRVLGIDLGTTNSAVAQIIFDPNNPESLKAECLRVVQKTESGDITLKTVPSVVAIKDEKVFVGEGAKRMIPKIAEKEFTKGVDIFYESKNEIGTRRSYHKAPKGFQSPAEISGKILEFIFNTVKDYDENEISKTVVTVPASFHPAQRMDTVTAAGYGGIFSINKGDLLDEPLASFISYIMNEGLDVVSSLKSKKNFLIFDFGGGTCDVSIVEIGKYVKGECLKILYKSVSRYHRLGGSDIDRAIIYDFLIPEFLKQNNIPKNELSYVDKKLYLEPALTGVAEFLKIGISNEISRLKKFEQYDSADKKSIKKIYNTELKIDIRGNYYTLKSPEINAADFENMMSDFVNKDFLYARETEYKLINSIFAPIEDSLRRCNMDSEDINYVLLTGGSSYLSIIQEEVKDYFKNAELLSFDNEDAYQSSIAAGAAYQSLFKIINGKGIVEQVNHYSISINTQYGPEELIPAGAPLPYPSGVDFEENSSLKIPETPEKYPYELQIEIVDTDNQFVLFKEVWEINSEVYEGQKIVVEYRMNENSIVEMKLKIKENMDDDFKCEIQNPLLNTVKPDTKRMEIEEIEHILKTERLRKDEKYKFSNRLANLYDDINYNEKAIELYNMILNSSQGDDMDLFNKLADLYFRINNYEKMEAFYKEGFRKHGWGGYMFNLAIKLKQKNELERALENINIAVEAEDSAPYLVLKAQILLSLNRKDEAESELEKAYNLFDPIEDLDDWGLGWYITMCTLRNDNENKKLAFEERRKRYGIIPDKSDNSNKPLPKK